MKGPNTLIAVIKTHDDVGKEEIVEIEKHIIGTLKVYGLDVDVELFIQYRPET